MDTILTIVVISLIIYFFFKIINSLFRDEKSETKTVTYNNYVATPQKLLSVDIDIPPSLTDEGLYLFLDVETTGLPEKHATPKNYDCYPRIVQFCWIILDKDYNCVEHKNRYVNFGGSVPYEATKVHGITTELLREKGVPTIDVLKEFSNDLDTVKLIIAHNSSFDLSIIQSEFYRHNLKNKLYRFPNYCTMHATTNICKVKRFSSGEYKYPKLEELFLYCNEIKDYDTKIPDAHDAEADVMMTIYSLKYMIENKKINQKDLFDAMKYYQKEDSNFSQIIDAHVYILKKLKNIDKLDDAKKTSAEKLINEKMRFLRDSNSIFFDNKTIAEIKYILNGIYSF